MILKIFSTFVLKCFHTTVQMWSTFGWKSIIGLLNLSKIFHHWPVLHVTFKIEKLTRLDYVRGWVIRISLNWFSYWADVDEGFGRLCPAASHAALPHLLHSWIHDVWKCKKCHGLHFCCRTRTGRRCCTIRKKTNRIRLDII